jgi:hypothetical protein
MTTATFGTNQVDWEQRLDFDKLRTERLAKLKAELATSDVGALLAFDFANIRYMSSTHIGTWAIDKAIRFALVTRNSDPIVWDFGSAAKHHQLYNPWLDTTTAEATTTTTSRDPAREPVRLYPRNEDVNNWNKECLERLQTPEHVFLACDLLQHHDKGYCVCP